MTDSTSQSEPPFVELGKRFLIQYVLPSGRAAMLMDCGKQIELTDDPSLGHYFGTEKAAWARILRDARDRSISAASLGVLGEGSLDSGRKVLRNASVLACTDIRRVDRVLSSNDPIVAHSQDSSCNHPRCAMCSDLSNPPEVSSLKTPWGIWQRP